MAPDGSPPVMSVWSGVAVRHRSLIVVSRSFSGVSEPGNVLGVVGLKL